MFMQQAGDGNINITSGIIHLIKFSHMSSRIRVSKSCKATSSAFTSRTILAQWWQ